MNKKLNFIRFATAFINKFRTAILTIKVIFMKDQISQLETLSLDNQKDNSRKLTTITKNERNLASEFMKIVTHHSLDLLKYVSNTFPKCSFTILIFIKKNCPQWTGEERNAQNR